MNETDKFKVHKMFKENNSSPCEISQTLDIDIQLVYKYLKEIDGRTKS